MNRKAPRFGAAAANGTRRRSLARIVRRSERKGARMARALRVAPSAERRHNPPDRLRRAGLI